MAREKRQKLVLRLNEENDNHHLWNNRGAWWCSITIHEPDATKKRYRFSLKTRDVEKARNRRDEFFENIKESLDVEYLNVKE